MLIRRKLPWLILARCMSGFQRMFAWRTGILTRSAFVACGRFWRRSPNIEKEAIQKAAERSIEGHKIRVAALAYLLFLKLTSERNTDFQDALRLVRRHRGRF